MKTLGLIVNPIAGMGGKVGLKGTDGEETLARALSLGASPESPVRAGAAISAIASHSDEIAVVAPPGQMGEEVLIASGLKPHLLPLVVGESTSSADTKTAADLMLGQGIDLLLFAGGDGTARDIVAKVQDRVVCLGIPTGVKMHSAVFAVNPTRGGELAAAHLFGAVKRTRAAEVMDIDEEALRAGHLSARLFGYMTVPYRQGHVQGLKAGSSEDERYAQESIAAGIMTRMERDVAYVIGPGTTTAEVMMAMGLDFSLVGVDLVRNGELLGTDLSEGELLELMGDGPGGIVVTPVGGQGYLFGRGNQPISAELIRRIGKDRIMVVATPGKLATLRGEPLRVDSGDPDTDRWLAGYYQVITGYRDRSVYRVSAA